MKVAIAIIGFSFLYFPLAWMLGSAIGRQLKERVETESRPVIRRVRS